jgi:hypothetical protein
LETTALGLGELARRRQRMDPGAPEGFVGIDVSQPGHRPLVEERSFDRRALAGQALAEGARPEATKQGLRAETSAQVVVQLPRLEQQPRTEAADVAIDDV